MLSLKVRNVTLSNLELIARHRQHHRTQQQCRRQLRWVPLAYRGAVAKESQQERPDRRADPGPSSSSLPSSPMRHQHKRRPLRKILRKPFHPTEGGGAGGLGARRGGWAKPSIERLELRLFGLHDDLLRFSEEYRSAFSTAVSLPLTRRGEDPSAISNSHQDGTIDENRATIRAIAQDIRALGRDIHQADQLVESSQIARSEDSFRGLSRVLKDIIRTAISFRRSGGGTNATGNELVELAEAALGTAVKLGSERALLVELTKTWSTIQKSPFSSLWPTSTLKELFGKMFSALTPEEAEETKGDSVTDDPLLFSPVLFRDVLDAIASDVRSKLEQMSSDDNSPHVRGRSDETSIPTEIDRAEVEATARRMVALLDVMPSSWLPDLGTMKEVLEMLCRAGTLASARLCYDTYKRHPINQNRLRFSLVLQSYLEAARYDPDESKRMLAAQEAYDALNREWNVNLPVHRVERIIHSTIVLNCLCAAGSNSKTLTTTNACELADETVKKSLGSVGFTKLLEDVDFNSSMVDPQTLPLVSCLIRIYAESGDERRVLQARKLLMYVMKHDSGAVGRAISYPMLDTFNLVLESLAREIEKQPRKKADPAALLEALDFSKSLADYMLRRRDSGSWPNDKTFTSLFRILLAVDPQDIGERADDIISMLDVRSYLSQTRTFNPSEADQCRSQNQDSLFNVSLSIYHRALRCWLRAAERPAAEHAAVRAWMLVEKLEAQSSPLLLSDRETQLRCVPPFYDIRLRPSGSTYRLVQKICLATANEENLADACNVALKVHERLQRKGMIAMDGSDDKGLACALMRLQPDNPARVAAERALNVSGATFHEEAGHRVAVSS